MQYPQKPPQHCLLWFVHCCACGVTRARGRSVIVSSLRTSATGFLPWYTRPLKSFSAGTTPSCSLRCSLWNRQRCRKVCNGVVLLVLCMSVCHARSKQILASRDMCSHLLGYSIALTFRFSLVNMCLYKLKSCFPPSPPPPRTPPPTLSWGEREGVGERRN